MNFSSIRRAYSRLVSWLVPGALYYPTEHRRLRLFWLEGVSSNVAEVLVASYAGLYLLALGGTTAQVGFQAAMLNLAAALAFFPGARLVERWGRRKLLVVLSGGIAGRLAVLGLVIAPLFFSSHAIILAIVACVALRGFFNSLATPAWTSLLADLVPLRLRGRYLASRQFGMAIAALATNILAGQAIFRLGAPAGYQWSFLCAFVIGLAATNFFARIPEPESQTVEAHVGPVVEHIEETGALRNFRLYVLTQFIWGLSLQISAPFFNIYLIQGLKGTAADVGILQAVQIIFTLVGLRFFGPRTDRRGPLSTVRLTGLLIPFMPMMWILVQAPWQVVFCQIPSGFLWAGFDLGNLALLLALTPAAQRERLFATYQTVIFTTAFVGPLVGGFLVSMLGFKPVLFISGIGRMAAMLLFAWLVRMPSRLEPQSPKPALVEVEAEG